MRYARRIAALVLVALLAASVSSMVTRTRLEVQDWDCPPAPASCARPVLVGGFPFAFLSDYHGISVVGRVSLLGGLLGEDHIHWHAFAMDAGIYALVATGAWAAWSRLRARRRGRHGGPAGHR